MQAPTQTDKVAILSTFLDDEAAQTPEEHQTYLQYYENELGVPSGSFNVRSRQQHYRAMPMHDQLIRG
jgi:hypothetical protein